MSKWQKILGGISVGLLTLSTVIPGVNVITLPIVGAIGLKAAIAGAGLWIGGWATRTPGHTATVQG